MGAERGCREEGVSACFQKGSRSSRWSFSVSEKVAHAGACALGAACQGQDKGFKGGRVSAGACALGASCRW